MSSVARSTTSGSGSQRASSGSSSPGSTSTTSASDLVGAGVRGLGEFVPGEDHLGAGVAQVERHLALLEQDVHRNDDRPGAQRAVVAVRELRHVGQHDRDAVARPDALRAQQAGDLRGRDVEGLVGQLQIVQLDRDAVRRARGAVREEVGEIGHGRQATAAEGPVMGSRARISTAAFVSGLQSAHGHRRRDGADRGRAGGRSGGARDRRRRPLRRPHPRLPRRRPGGRRGRAPARRGAPRAAVRRPAPGSQP